MNNNFSNSTSNQAASNQTNVFKPNSKIVRNLPKPTPMDTTLSNTKFTQNPNFQPKELFNYHVDPDYTVNPQSAYDSNNYFDAPQLLHSDNQIKSTNYDENPNFEYQDEIYYPYETDYTFNNSDHLQQSECDINDKVNSNINFHIATNSTKIT